MNIRAPFYQLMATIRSMYDPSAVRDPRSLGLITDDGTRLRAAITSRRWRSRMLPPLPLPKPPTRRIHK